MMPYISLLLLLLFSTVTAAAEESLLIDDFEHGLKTEWRVNEFQGETEYRVVADESTRVLQAVSNGTASALVYQEEFLLDEYPVISWRWKIESVIAQGDAAHKQSDDYAARIYIVFSHWFYPNTRSLNYIWANKLEQGRVVPSPFTDNSVMIAVESGPRNVGSWQTVRRNIADDFRQAFGMEPPEKWTIAIMTDTDNTGGRARAWYDDIRLEKE